MSHGGPGRVPIEPFREAFLRSGMTASELARKLGYWRTLPNLDRARRAIGLRVDTDSRIGKRNKPRQTVTYRQAAKLADALGLDYTDVGI